MLIVVPKPFPNDILTPSSEFSCDTQEILFMSLPLRNNRRATQCSVWLWVTMWLSGQNKTRGTWLLRPVLHNQLQLPHFFLWLENLALYNCIKWSQCSHLFSIWRKNRSIRHSSSKNYYSYNNSDKNSISGVIVTVIVGIGAVTIFFVGVKNCI